MTRTIICGIAMAIAARSMAQITFQRVLGGVSDDEGTCATLTSDGGYVIGGYTNSPGSPGDAWFLKLDATGTVLWSRTFGDAGSEKAYDIKEHPNGQLWCTGSSDLNADGNQEAYLLIMDAAGFPISAQVFDPPGVAEGMNFVFTADGGAALTMFAQFPGYKYGVVRLDQNGALLWKQNYATSIYTYGGGVVERPNGELLCVGAAYQTQYDLLLLRLDPNGVALSSPYWAGPGNQDEGAFVIEALDDEGYVIAGETHGQGAGLDNVLLMRMDSSLNTTWARAYGTAGRSLRSFAAGQTPDGGFFSGVHDYTGDGAEDMGLVRTDANGDLLWTRAYGAPGVDVCHKAIACPDGGFLVVGYTESFGSSGRDMYLVKTDASGNVSEGAQFCYSAAGALSGAVFSHTIGLFGILTSDVMTVSEPIVSGVTYAPARDTVLCADISTGLAESELGSRLTIFPVPCIDRVTVDLDVVPKDVVDLQLLDAVGRMILSERTTARTCTLDLSDVPAGEYLLVARTADRARSHRLAVVH
ncbi:MAG: T9SS type A sorting domain-containing protein [Flavobacteriales bacterium]|nr:T9SS type A sorting domain-containing protein [Flavobacteriales bacterium]